MFRIISSENLFKSLVDYFQPSPENNILLYASKNLDPNIIQVKSKHKEFSVYFVPNPKKLATQNPTALAAKYDYVFLRCGSRKDLQGLIGQKIFKTKGIFLCNKLEEILLFVQNFVLFCESQCGQILEYFQTNVLLFDFFVV